MSWWIRQDKPQHTDRRVLIGKYCSVISTVFFLKTEHSWIRSGAKNVIIIWSGGDYISILFWFFKSGFSIRNLARTVNVGRKMVSDRKFGTVGAPGGRFQIFLVHLYYKWIILYIISDAKSRIFDVFVRNSLCYLFRKI